MKIINAVNETYNMFHHIEKNIKKVIPPNY